MPLTSFKPVLGYCLSVGLLGLLATILHSSELTWLAVAAHVIGWIVFLFLPTEN